MADEPFELSVEDVSAMDASGPGDVDDTIESGTNRPTAIVLALIAVAGVAAVVIGSRHDRPVAAVPLTVPSVVDAPGRFAPRPDPLTRAPNRTPTAALVDDATTRFDVVAKHGGTVSMLIRNRLTRSVMVRRVELIAQPGVQVRSTSVRAGRSLGLDCLTPADEHTSVGYSARPGPLWIAARLSRTPACGGEVRAAWRVTYVDRGHMHRVTLIGATFTTVCSTRPHPWPGSKAGLSRGAGKR